MININKLNYILFSLVIILYPINYKLALFFRPSDLLICILMLSFLLFYKFTFDYFFFLLLSFLFIFISTFLSYSNFSDTDFINYVFIYKIFSIVLIIACIDHFSKIKWDKFIHKALFALFIFQILWVFIYGILIKLGLDGNVRVSFIFSNLEDRRMSDAHLYGNLLALSLIFYLMFWKEYFNINYIYTVIIILLTCAAVLMTGSKNPLLIILIYFCFIYIPIFIRKTLITDLLKTFIILIFFYLLFKNQIIDIINFTLNYLEGTRYQALLNRIYYGIVSPAGDDSYSGRIKNFYLAISFTEYSFGIFGRGLNSTFRYFDGFLSIIIALGGFIFVLLFIFFTAFHFIKLINTYQNYEIFKKYLIFLSLVLISIFITEFIFITRWMIPVVSMLILLYLECFKISLNK